MGRKQGGKEGEGTRRKKGERRGKNGGEKKGHEMGAKRGRTGEEGGKKWGVKKGARLGLQFLTSEVNHCSPSCSVCRPKSQRALRSKTINPD